MSTAIGDGVVAFARVVRAVCRNAANLLVLRNLAEQIRQHRCIADMAPGDLHGPDLQRFFVDAEVDLAPYPAFRAAVFASVPFPFAFDLDPGAIDQQVHRPLGPAIRDVYSQRLLTAREGAEVGHRPVETDQPQQALHEPSRLSKGHAEQDLHRKARLDRCIAIGLLAATPACRHGIPAHLGVEPDRQRAA